MNPLPAAVLAALSICSHHYQNATWVGTGHLDIAACIREANCPILAVRWNIGYEKCDKIYNDATSWQMRIAEKQWAEEERIRGAKERQAAKKDQPTLDAAMAALK